VSKHIVAHGDDLMDDDPRLARSLVIWPKNFPSASGPFAINGLCWIYAGLMNLCNVFRLLLVDYQIIEAKDIVLVANSAAIVGVYKLDHG